MPKKSAITRKNVNTNMIRLKPFLLYACVIAALTFAFSSKADDPSSGAVFFNALKKYVERNESPWCTPGHQGGIGFQKGEPGISFYKFFGGNIFKADVSCSMTELGSILGHTGPVKEAEDSAAKIFGADYTFFVTNGTSTSNKIIFHATTTAGDIVLIDRNCHKSSMHAIIMTRSIPVYYHPARNSYGIIGPVGIKEFSTEDIETEIMNSPLIPSEKKKQKPSLSILTNSTYDGICYNVRSIKDILAPNVRNMLFDEAWYAYARFYPLYTGRFAMDNTALKDKKYPPVFATQSTHKMLSAFSMASMIHIKNGTDHKIDPSIFNEAWLMHTTTSPFYPLVASIDVAAQMMGGKGERIIKEMLLDAVKFRKKMLNIRKDELGRNSWWYKAWQPEKVKLPSGTFAFENVDNNVLISNPDIWVLKDGDQWHGFENVGKENILLDPLKVTLLTPGLTDDGHIDDIGIPAPVLGQFMEKNLIIPEKVGFYNILFLFSPGVSEEKAERLEKGLYEFKKAYDRNAPLKEIFPELLERYPGHYRAGMGLKDLCSEMHNFLKDRNILSLMKETYLVQPEQAVIPAVAYDKIIRNEVEYVPIRKLEGRISAIILAPYPPGIPLVMPGERLTASSRKILDYFLMNEEVDNKFPGFEIEIHGMKIKEENGRKNYEVLCLK